MYLHGTGVLNDLKKWLTNNSTTSYNIKKLAWIFRSDQKWNLHVGSFPKSTRELFRQKPELPECDTKKKKWNKIQIICVTSRAGVIWGYELVCEWLIQDVWRTSSQSLETLIRLKRLSWTVRPIGRLSLHVAFYERPLKIRDVIFIEIETKIIINNHNGFIFRIWTHLV